MIAPAAIRRTPDQAVRFEVDPDAEPGNVIPTLAALLIGADRRRRERAAEGDGEHGAQEQDHQSIPTRTPATLAGEPG